MIDLYCDSTIRIVSVLKDKYGAITSHESADVPARIESYNRLIINNKGQEVFGDMVIKFNKKYMINYDDFIKIKKFKDTVFEMPDKQFIVKKITKPNGFSMYWNKIWV